MITLEVIGDIPYPRRNSESCQPRGATASDYIVPRVVGMLSVKDGAQDSNVDEAADSIIDPPAPDAGEEDENAILNLRQEAKSLRHLLTHKPANKYCDACILGKMRGSKKFCGSYERNRQPTRWLELATADHLVAQKTVVWKVSLVIVMLLLSKTCSLRSRPYFLSLVRPDKRLRMSLGGSLVTKRWKSFLLTMPLSSS